MTHVKLYGLQRSGTNVAKGLLEVNFEDVVVLQSILGSKHRPFDRQRALSWQSSELDARYVRISAEEIDQVKESLRTRRMCAVLSIKSPYSWLVSYYRLAKRKERERRKKRKRHRLHGRIAPSAWWRWLLVRRARKSAPSPVQWNPVFIRNGLLLWIRMNRDWLHDLRDEFGDKLIVSFYDEIVVDSGPWLEAVESRFSLTRKCDLITSLPKATLRGNDSHFGEAVMSEERFDRGYYLERRYRNRFTDEEKDIATAILNEAPGVLKRYIVW